MTTQHERKILLVGGAGYVGSVMTSYLLNSGYRVKSFDALIYNNQATVLPFLSHPNFEFQLGRLTSPDDLEGALDGITDIVLLAGLVGDPITNKYRELSDQINVSGYDGLLTSIANRSFRNVIFVSTCSNYGLIEEPQIADEDSPLSPLSPYAEAKVSVEQKILGLKPQANFSVTVLRFATAFGLSPRMRFDLTINEFTRELMLGRELSVYDADTWRPYCHVLDFAGAIERVLEAKAADVNHQVFNVGGDDNNSTKRGIVDSIRKYVKTGKVVYLDKGKDRRNYRVSFDKIKARLGFEPKYTIDHGIGEIQNAVESGLFLSIDQPESFFGNYRIDPNVCGTGRLSYQ